MIILITGGTGFIGSHTAVELLENGHSVVVVDNLVNSNETVLERIKEITGKSVNFYQIDLRQQDELEKIFELHRIDVVVHFAGLKAVGESVEKPLQYYDNNIVSTICLLKVMEKYAVNKLVFSSSATVYGEPGTPIYTESLPTGQNISSPYGQTKHMIEKVISDFAIAHPKLEVSILRYFNPVGAHESGLIGEDPVGTPNNLMPYVAQVAAGKRDRLSIFGNDYPTPDGTCRRDYIHVVDLAKGHVAALSRLSQGVSIYNLGSGRPTSVLELINAFTNTTGKEIAFEFAPRRSGDLPEFYADPKKANEELGWKATKSIEDMCRDTWNWQSKNPNGYSSPA